MRKTKLIITTILIIIITGIICVSCVTHADKIEYYVGNKLYATDTISAKSRYSLPKVPTKSGYIFAGWYYDKGEWHRPFDYTNILPDENNSIKVYANFIRGEFESVTINLEPNNGSARMQYFVSADTLDLPKVDKEGYLFIGWYQDRNLTMPFLYNRKLHNNETLYAKWEYASEVTVVSYDSHGGSVIPAQVVAIGNKITAPIQPSREDYAFDGWYTSEDYREMWDFDVDTVDTGVTLHAKWKLLNIKVRFEISSEDAPQEYKIVVGERAPTITLPDKVGQEFVGWYTDRELTQLFDMSSLLQQNTTLYAKWKKIVIGYNIEYVSDGVVIATEKAESNSKICNRIADPSRENLVFAGWYKDEQLSSKWNFREDIVTNNTRLFARFLAPTQGMNYALQADNTYTLTGIGRAFDEKKIVIPEKYNGKYVARIADNALANQNSTSVYIPNTVKVIGSGALANMTNLSKLELARGVQSIAKDFCKGTDAISEIVIDSGNASYLSRDNVMYSSDYKTLVKFATGSADYSFIAPIGVEIINDYALANSQLIEVILPNTLREIGAFAFNNSTNLQYVTFGVGVKTIGDKAFFGCYRLEKAILPNDMRGIGASAFGDCSGLNELRLPVECGYIMPYAFENCLSLTSVYAPSSISIIKEYAFANLKCKIYINANTIPTLWDSRWTNVSDINIVQKNVNLSKDGVWLYSIDNNTAYINGYLSNDTTVEIPYEVDGKQVVGFGGTFANNNKLKKVTIDGRIGCVSDGAFYNCSNLVEVLINSGITSIGDRAFFGCSSLSDINLPRSVRDVGFYAFNNCVSLQNVTLSDNMTSIPEAMFMGCTSLYNVYLLSGIVEIGDSAFSGCINLTTVLWNTKIAKIGSSAFEKCQKLRDIKLPSSIVEIGEYAFDGCEQLVSVILPNALQTLPSHVFYNCSQLSSVTVDGDKGYATIEESAFENCTSLPNILLPNALTSIGRGAFKGCGSLSDINLPNTLEWIGDSAFAKCSTLTKIAFPKLACIGASAFSDCLNLQYATLFDVTQEIFANAFSGCGNMSFFINGSNVSNWSAGWNNARPYYLAGEWSYVNGIPTII